MSSANADFDEIASPTQVEGKVAPMTHEPPLPDPDEIAWSYIPEGPSAPNGLVRYGKFLVVGLTGVIVNLAAFVLTVDGVSHTPVSNFYASVLHFASKTAANPLLYFVGSAVAFVVATLWNFVLNNLWTFKTAADFKHSPTRRLGLYFGVSLGSLAVNEVILLATETILPPLFGQGFGIIAGSVVGFIGNSRYTFTEVKTP